MMHIIMDYLDTIPNLSASEKAKLNYFFSCIIYEGSKIILFFIFFAATHRLKGFLYSLIILLPLRIISGGLHFKHYLTCLAFSFGYFYLVNVPLSKLIPEYSIALTILCVCMVINYLTGPIVSSARPALPLKRIQRGKFHILVITCYETLLTALFYDTKLAPIGFWTITLHSIQLLIANIHKKRGDYLV